MTKPKKLGTGSFSILDQYLDVYSGPHEDWDLDYSDNGLSKSPSGHSVSFELPQDMSRVHVDIFLDDSRQDSSINQPIDQGVSPMFRYVANNMTITNQEIKIVGSLHTEEQQLSVDDGRYDIVLEGYEQGDTPHLALSLILRC